MTPRAALVAISVGVLLASSTWFSGTAATGPLIAAWRLTAAEAVWLTISVQLGFITGTLLYAFANLADVYPPRRVFFVSALAGAAANAAFAWLSHGLAEAIVFRFLTGVTLAGVYPVGMKMVASWFGAGLGWRLGVMVGALTLGTASPYLMRALDTGFDWRTVAGAASVLALAGGALVLRVPEGPHLKSTARFDPRVLARVFRDRSFRLTAFGYFGHMWELYAFWALVATWLAAAGAVSPPLLAFVVIAAGAFGCAAGGWISRRTGERRVALFSLAVSGTACALSGLAFNLPAPALIAFVVIWGVFVVADSPQFSSLAARYAPREYVGTALTIQNGIGFLITTVSIQLLPLLAERVGWRWSFLFLLPGPVAGAIAMRLLGRIDHRDTEAQSGTG